MSKGGTGGAPRLTRQQKKERARQKLAERGLLTPEPKLRNAAASPRARDVGGPEGAAGGEEPIPDRFPVPPGVRTVARVDSVMGLACLVVAGLRIADVGVAYLASPAGGSSSVPTLLLLGGGFLMAAQGLRGLHPFGRAAQLALCVASLPLGGLAIPSAALIGIYMVLPGVALLFSGRAPRALTRQERGRVQEDALGTILVRVAAFIQAVILIFRMWPVLQAL